MPKPIPVAILGNVGASDLPKPAVLAMAATAHLTYGGIWGGILAKVTRRVTIWKALGLGAGLWLVMQMLVLPLLEWGAFGASVTVKIAATTLVLHLVYGTVLGGLMDRRQSPSRETTSGAEFGS